MNNYTKFDCVWYVYSSYWGTWSRYLGKRNGYFIEVDLCPINWSPVSRIQPASMNFHRANWNETARGRIRLHLTARTPRDTVTWETPPKDVVDTMVEMLGGSTADWLLKADLLENVDLERYDALYMKQSPIFLDQIWKVQKEF